MKPQRGLCALLLVVLPTTLLGSPAQAALPSQAQWLADVHTAMLGSRIDLGRRIDQVGASAVGKKLAVNLDIDNTSLASHYDFGAAVPDVLRYARYARSRGVVLLFNTGRLSGDGRQLLAKRQLTRAGYLVTEVCARRAGEELVAGKQRCRQKFVDEGYTLVSNVGNNATDFLGDGYEQAYQLPNYDHQLS